MQKKKIDKKKICFTLIFMLFAFVNNSDVSAKRKIVVTGQVYDTITSQPLKNATIHVLELEKKIRTDKFGRYKVYIPRYNKYTFIVTAVFYGAVYHKFSVDKSMEYNFKLDRYKDVINLNRYPNILKPGIINAAEQKYPELAKELQVEAQLVINLLVAASGRVKRIKVLSMTLSKELEGKLAKKIRKEFIKHTLVKYFEARFDRTLLNDKYVPVEFDTFLNYKLKEKS
jgi:hypothetical protein